MYGADAEAKSPVPFLLAGQAARRDAPAPRGPQRWSARRTLCFILVTCGGFWATVLALILR